ncbi:MAG TPA: hypothetical protein VF590_20205 [Isosphaeraceae bacterium]|jgi:hypothetical protein
MTDQTVTLIDRSGRAVATARVAEREGYFAGPIDLGPMPAALRKTFEEYEEIIHGQMFSLLDEIEERIGVLALRVVFGEGPEVDVEDLQIFPGTGRVSFKALKEPIHIRDQA